MSSAAPEEDRQCMVKLYNAGSTYQQVAMITGYCKTTCQKYVQLAGIKSRYRYECNKTVFDIIDTEEKAYWLGFLGADGNVSDNRIALKLQYGDIEHIRKFKRFLSAEHPLFEVAAKQSEYNGATINGGRAIGIRVGNSHMAKALAIYGVVPAKSLILKPPVGVPDELMRHYWRGMIDGDGTVSELSHWRISLTSGSIDMIEGFLNFVQQYVETNSTVRQKGERVFVIEFGGVALAQNVASLLYDGATIYLDRKYAKYQKCMATPVLKVNRVPKKDSNEIVELYKSGYKYADVAKLTGYSELTCQSRVAAAGVESRFANVSKAKAAEMIDLYEDGNLYVDVARLTGYAVETCRHHIQAAGVKTRSPKIPTVDCDKMISLYQEGYPYTSIARLTGYSDVTCAKYVKASGIPLR